MIIGVCGFTSTGSSAVSDYLKEFDSLEVIDNLEFNLCYFPDGIEDLDYHLNAGSSKFNSSTIAIPRFRKIANILMGRKTEGRIKELTDDYLNALIQVSWIGLGADYGLHSGTLSEWIYINIGRRLLIYRIYKLLENFGHIPKSFPFRLMEYSANPEQFDECTKKYVNDIISVFQKYPEKPVVLDQPFAGNNPQKSFKYFTNPKAIVVDRDPRDVFLFAIKVLKNHGHQIPTDTVEHFVEYYRRMRDGMPYKKTDPKVKLLRFEDLIYEYDKTTREIRDFLGLCEPDYPKSVFDPALSINNTQLFKRFPEYSEDIAYIEQELEEYLYPFEQYSGVELPHGTMFFGRSPLNLVLRGRE